MSVGESEAAMSRGETGWEEGSGGPCPKGAAPEEAESSSKEKDEAIGDFDEKACVNDGVAPSASESTESPSEPATKEGVEAPAAANSASDDLAEETARVCAAWGGEEGQSVAAWLRREGLAGIHELLVEALLTPTPKTNAGSRLASLASRAAQLPAVPGVVYDPHHYQFLARYFETPGSTSPTTKRFPLRRWGFLKSFKFACDAVLGAHKPGDFSDSEVQPVDETVARDLGRGEPSLVESYVLAEHPHLVLPVVKGVSRDKKSRRWAVYYRGQRHYFYDKNAGGCRRAYKLAVGLRRQQVEEVELLQSFEEIVAGQQRTAAAECRPCPGPCMRAVVAALLFDLVQYLDEKGERELGLGPSAVSALVSVVKAHAAAVKTAVGAAPVIDHIAVLKKCISEQLLPSQLPPAQLLLLLQKLLVLQMHSACDLLVQTGLWRCIVAHAKGQLQGVGVALSSPPQPEDASASAGTFPSVGQVGAVLAATSANPQTSQQQASQVGQISQAQRLDRPSPPEERSDGGLPPELECNSTPAAAEGRDAPCLADPGDEASSSAPHSNFPEGVSSAVESSTPMAVDA